MKDKFTIPNITVGVLTALVLFMGRWVLDVNTDVALLNQRIAAEEKLRAAEDVKLHKDMAKAEDNYAKMADTMGKLDKTLSLLVDRLDRGDITVRSLTSNNK